MPESHALPFRERLAIDLSDLVLSPDRGAAAPADLIIHTHFVGMGDLPPPPEDPLRRRDDPMAALYRQVLADPHGDFKKAEPVLLKWLRASADRAERFAEDPAAIVRQLPGLDAAVKERLARHFGPPAAGNAIPRLAGLAVKEMTFDAKPAGPPPVAAALVKSGEVINADVLFQVGFSQLQRIFAEKLLPAIRAAASEVSFLTGPAGGLVAGTLRLLVERPGDPDLEIQPDGSLKMTIGFAISQLEVPPLNLGSLGINVDLGAVTLEAKLALTTTDRSGGADVNLSLAAGGLTFSSPAGLTTLLTPHWNAATARAVEILGPLFAFPIPLQYPQGLCDIAPRKVKAALLPAGTGDGTQPSLALAIALLPTTDVNMLDAGTSSRVAAGQDGSMPTSSTGSATR